ncbi:hypothetical protein HNR23_001538 [Nocardiopsis mwathae]|uniref:Uncharacterized protein n=1 Tax=Nocardiopsis mwathae TaxID=1472723 RepID=A0A7W9YG19_9ACTN|nr:hypothetical protein [Nocardiopsis mwathae]
MTEGKNLQDFTIPAAGGAGGPLARARPGGGAAPDRPAGAGQRVRDHVPTGPEDVTDVFQLA